jgi:hypothetical protein
MIDENSCYIGMSVIWRDYDDPDLYPDLLGEVIGFSRGKDSLPNFFVVLWENGVTITYYYNKVPDSLVVDYEKVRSDKLEALGI